MRDRYPDAVIMDIDKAADLKEGHYKAAPKQITEAQFHDMLECLPPMDYRCANGWTTFKMCELTCGNITGIYATNGDKYYAMQDSQFLRHADIVSKITEVQP